MLPFTYISTVIIISSLLDGTYATRVLPIGFYGNWDRRVSNMVLFPEGEDDVEIPLACEVLRLSSILSKNPEAEVAWLKNGLELSDLDPYHVLYENGMIIIKGTNLESKHTSFSPPAFGDEYRCLLRLKLDGVDYVVSAPPISLVKPVLGKATIINYVTDTQVNDSSLRLSCVVNSVPQARLTWEKDGSRVEPNPRFVEPSMGVLQILRVEEGDSGVYRCIADNIFLNRTVVSEPVRIIVSTQMNLSQAITNSNSQTLAKETASMPTKTPISNDFNQSYSLHLSNQNQIGGNDVFHKSDFDRIDENDGNRSVDFSVNTILARPARVGGKSRVFYPIKPVLLNENENYPVVLECMISGGTNSSVIWEKKGARNGGDWEAVVYSDRVSLLDGSANLLFKFVTQQDAGVYVCRISSNAPRSEEISLLVVSSPKMQASPRNLTRLVAQTVRLQCIPSIEFYPTFAQFSDRDPIHDVGVTPPPSKANSMNHNPAQLSALQSKPRLNSLIPEISKKYDDDTYRKNSRFYRSPTDMADRIPDKSNFSQGSDHNFEFGEDLDHRGRIRWFKDGFSFAFDSRIQTANSGTELVLTNIETSDQGIYQCLITNKAGYSTAWARLTVMTSSDAPDPPSGLSYSMLSPTSVRVEWEPSSDPNNPVAAYSVYLNKIGPSPADQETVTTDNWHVFDNLKADSEYFFYVRAYTDLGSDPSKKMYFSTSSGVVNFRLSALTASSLLVSWKPLSYSGGGNPLVEYVLQWKMKRRGEYYNQHEVSPSERQYMIDKLLPEKTYEVRVLPKFKSGLNIDASSPSLWKVVTMPGLGGPQHDDNERRLPSKPLVRIYDVSPKSFSGNGWPRLGSFKVTYKKSSSEGKGRISGFSLRYKKGSVTEWGPKIPLQAKSKRSYLVKDVEPGWYSFKVTAININGEVPATVQDLYIGWDPTIPGGEPNPNGMIESHRSRENPKSTVRTHHSAAESYDFVDKPDTFLKTRSPPNENHNDDSNKPKSISPNTTSSLTTDLTSIDPDIKTSPHIIDLKIVSESPTMAHLTWSVFPERFQVSFYTVQEKVTAGDEELYKDLRRSTMPFISLDRLSPFVPHEFRVRAHVNQSHFGPFSNPIRVEAKGGVTDRDHPLLFIPKDASTLKVFWDPAYGLGREVKREVTEPRSTDYDPDRDSPGSNSSSFGHPQEVFLPAFDFYYEVFHSSDANFTGGSPPPDDLTRVDGWRSSIEIANLVSNTVYWFRLRVCVLESLCSPFSAPQSSSIPAVLRVKSNTFIIAGIAGLTTLLLILLSIVALSFHVHRTRALGNTRSNRNCLNLRKPKYRIDPPEIRRDSDYIPMLSRVHLSSNPTQIPDTKGGISFPNVKTNRESAHKSSLPTTSEATFLTDTEDAPKSYNLSSFKQQPPLNGVSIGPENRPPLRLSVIKNVPIRNPSMVI